MVSSRSRVSALSAASILGFCGMAHGQAFTTGFEAPDYTGAAAGTLATGQQGWYLPPAGGLDHNIFTYAGNTLGVVANPTGGAQFDAGQAPNVARFQHDVPGFAAGGQWIAEFDVNGLYVGTLPAIDNLGSFSLQDSLVPARYFQQLMNWGSTSTIIVPGGGVVTNYTATADKFHMPIGYFTAASPTVIIFEIASAAWMDLPVNHWYHVTCKWDFTTAQINEVSIKDLTANTATVTDNVTSRGWYLAGGPGSTNALPTAIRLFAGGAGSVTAWDNVRVAPAGPAPCYANCDGSTTPPILNVLDFICFQTQYAQNSSSANCDGSTNPPVLNVLDFICFQTKYAQGCP